MRRLVIAACVCAVVVPACAQTKRLYDKYGLSRGTLDHEGSRTVQRDQYGLTRGTYQRDGQGRVVHRDANGLTLGYSQPRGIGDEADYPHSALLGRSSARTGNPPLGLVPRRRLDAPAARSRAD